MKISKEGINLIKKYEGCHLVAYRCPAGVRTIGYGHTQDVFLGQKINQKQADDLLTKDLERYEGYVNKYNDDYHFTQNQFDALVSFTFNCGKGNLDKLTDHGKRTIREISDALPNYNKGGGKVLEGLVKRRAEEKAMFDGKPDIVGEVIAGKWGSGNDRRQRLTKAGYDYDKIQAEVNARLNK